MKQVTVTVHQDLRQLGQPDPWLKLLQIRFPDGEQRNLVPNPENVTFQGITYQRIALEVGQQVQDLQGGLAEMEVIIQNVTREMSALVETKELRGTTIRMLIVNRKRLTDPTAILEDILYEVNEYQVTDSAAVVRLGHDSLLKQRAPYGRILRDNCRWVYNMPQGRSPECGYVDSFTGPGRISGASTTIIGTDTDFLRRFLPNIDSITHSGTARLVTAVASDTSLTIASPFPVGAGNSVYQVVKPSCGKMLEGSNGCRSHSNQHRFGGFPGLPVVTGGL